MPDRLTSISPYTVVVAMVGLFWVEVEAVVHLAIVGVWEDRFLAVIGTCTVIGVTLSGLLIKLGPALRKLVPAVVEIKQALRDLGGAVSANTDRAEIALKRADEAEAKYRDLLSQVATMSAAQNNDRQAVSGLAEVVGVDHGLISTPAPKEANP